MKWDFTPRKSMALNGSEATFVHLRPDQIELRGRVTLGVIAFYSPDTGLTSCDVRSGGAPFANFWPLPSPVQISHRGASGSFTNTEAAYQALKWWHDEPTRQKFEKCCAPGLKGGGDAFRLKRQCEKRPELKDNLHTKPDGLGRWDAMLLVLRGKWRQKVRAHPFHALVSMLLLVSLLAHTLAVSMCLFRRQDFRELLCGSAGLLLVEHSTKAGRDPYWSDDHAGGGQNRLGAALMLIRDELLAEAGEPSGWPAAVPRPTWAGGSDSDAAWQAIVDEVASALVQMDADRTTQVRALLVRAPIHAVRSARIAALPRDPGF